MINLIIECMFEVKVYLMIKFLKLFKTQWTHVDSASRAHMMNIFGGRGNMCVVVTFTPFFVTWIPISATSFFKLSVAPLKSMQ